METVSIFSQEDVAAAHRHKADESYIVTAYDPKSASDYQCTGAPREWKVEGACKNISVSER